MWLKYKANNANKDMEKWKSCIRHFSNFVWVRLITIWRGESNNESDQVEYQERRLTKEILIACIILSNSLHGIFAFYRANEKASGTTVCLRKEIYKLQKQRTLDPQSRKAYFVQCIIILRPLGICEELSNYSKLHRSYGLNQNSYLNCK